MVQRAPPPAGLKTTTNEQRPGVPGDHSAEPPRQRSERPGKPSRLEDRTDHGVIGAESATRPVPLRPSDGLPDYRQPLHSQLSTDAAAASAPPVVHRGVTETVVRWLIVQPVVGDIIMRYNEARARRAVARLASRFSPRKQRDHRRGR